MRKAAHPPQIFRDFSGQSSGYGEGGFRTKWESLNGRASLQRRKNVKPKEREKTALKLEKFSGRACTPCDYGSIREDAVTDPTIMTGGLYR